MRLMSQAGHVGKLVACKATLSMATPGGALLITGGTGGLGAVITRWAVENTLAAALLLLGRSGRAAHIISQAEACAVSLARCASCRIT